MKGLSENQEQLLKSITIKLETKYNGISSTSSGSGVIYKTSLNSNFDYILTALHCVYGKRTNTIYEYETLVDEIEISRKNEESNFDKTIIKSDKIIPIKSIDIAILLIEKNKFNDAREIVLGDSNFRGCLNSFGYPKYSDGDPYNFEHETKIHYQKDKKFKIECKSSLASYNTLDKLSGYSGSGLLEQNKPILIGVITEITDDEGLTNGFIAKKLVPEKLNSYLSKYEGETLEPFRSTEDSDSIGLDDNNNIIDYKKININGIEINLWRAIKRLKQDLRDDWFQDPLDFKFWLSKEFIFKRIKKYLNNSERNYKPSIPAKHYVIPKSGFSTRPSIETSLIDRVMYQAYIDKLSENLDFILNNKIYSFRYNSGKNNNKYIFHYSIEQWMKYVYQTKFVLNEESPYLVVADITNFYENIHIGLLIENIKELIHDHFRQNESLSNELEKVINALQSLITKWNEKLINKEFGIPQNRDASSFLANLFLKKIDNIMINTNGYSFYYRYMDDIRIVCETESEARKAICDLSKALRQNGLNLNSSKTKILCFTNQQHKESILEHLPDSLLQLEQITSLIKTKRKREVQKAVHMTYNLFQKTISDDNNEESFLKKRKISFCISKLQQFARIPGLKQSIDYRTIIDYTLNELTKQPWLTVSFIQLLRAINKSYFKTEDYTKIKEILLDPNQNIYEGQTYYLWLFLAYHRFSNTSLIDYAVKKVKSPNQDNQADTAGAYLYLASIKWQDYKDIMLKSLNHGDIGKNYFLQKNVLIALRMVSPEKIENTHVAKDLKGFHEKLYARNKEIFVADLPDLKISDIIKDSPTLISL